LKSKLRPDSAVVIQTTSPLIARDSFWCIVDTLAASGFDVKPYHATVPSFGVWGFALAKTSPFQAPATAPQGVELSYLNDQMFPAMFHLPTDISRPDHEIEINRLDNQALVRYYETEWRRFEQ